ncbi:serine-rich adhesin for platelets [Aplysia californica]|uniref:Serine-rich adhesin for platelets n=1 Tax=Aplysia californica TaxID=6500 RepID=A0ABM0ZYW7_APLCA|nr:serine-rich adhesin for platelets [Aplysia californica]
MTFSSGHIMSLCLLAGLCLLVSLSSLEAAQDSLCTTDFKGTPSCNFDSSCCTFKSVSSSPNGSRWVRSTDGPISHDWQRPGKTKIGSYVYLNASSDNSSAILIGQLDSSIQSVCVELHFATSQPSSFDVRVYNTMSPNDVTESTLLYEFQNLSSVGQWKTLNVPPRCVLQHSYIAFESSGASQDGTVALDYIKITRSSLNCPNSDSQCSNVTRGTPSCNFDRTMCSWSQLSVTGNGPKWTSGGGAMSVQGPISHDWQPAGSNKRGSYVFTDLSNVTTPVTSTLLLASQLGADISAVCIEFHYASTGQLQHRLRVYDSQSTSEVTKATLLYEINDISTGGRWMTAQIFSRCVQKNSFVVFEVTNVTQESSVALDYIKITRSSKACSTFIPTSTAASPTSPTPTFGRCSNNTRGTPSCSFDHNLCSWTTSLTAAGAGPKWARGGGADQVKGPIPHDWQPEELNKTGSYVFADVPQNTSSRRFTSLLTSQLAADIRAVCVDFHYATSGTLNHTIGVYVSKSPSDVTGATRLYEVKDVNTGGHWISAHISSQRVDENSYLSFQVSGVSHESTVALDYIAVTRSTSTRGRSSSPSPNPPTEVTSPQQATTSPKSAETDVTSRKLFSSTPLFTSTSTSSEFSHSTWFSQDTTTPENPALSSGSAVTPVSTYKTSSTIPDTTVPRKSQSPLTRIPTSPNPSPRAHSTTVSPTRDFSGLSTEILQSSSSSSSKPTPFASRVTPTSAPHSPSTQHATRALTSSESGVPSSTVSSESSVPNSTVSTGGSIPSSTVSSESSVPSSTTSITETRSEPSLRTTIIPATTPASTEPVPAFLSTTTTTFSPNSGTSPSVSSPDSSVTFTTNFDTLPSPVTSPSTATTSQKSGTSSSTVNSSTQKSGTSPSTVNSSTQKSGTSPSTVNSSTQKSGTSSSTASPTQKTGASSSTATSQKTGTSPPTVTSTQKSGTSSTVTSTQKFETSSSTATSPSAATSTSTSKSDTSLPVTISQSTTTFTSRSSTSPSVSSSYSTVTSSPRPETSSSSQTTSRKTPSSTKHPSSTPSTGSATETSSTDVTTEEHRNSTPSSETSSHKNPVTTSVQLTSSTQSNTPLTTETSSATSSKATKATGIASSPNTSPVSQTSPTTSPTETSGSTHAATSPSFHPSTQTPSSRASLTSVTPSYVTSTPDIHHFSSSNTQNTRSTSRTSEKRWLTTPATQSESPQTSVSTPGTIKYSSPIAEQNSEDPLKPGAKAAIIVCASLVCVALIAVAGVVAYKNGKRRKQLVGLYISDAELISRTDDLGEDNTRPVNGVLSIKNTQC